MSRWGTWLRPLVGEARGGDRQGAQLVVASNANVGRVIILHVERAFDPVVCERTIHLQVHSEGSLQGIKSDTVEVLRLAADVHFPAC